MMVALAGQCSILFNGSSSALRVGKPQTEGATLAQPKNITWT